MPHDGLGNVFCFRVGVPDFYGPVAATRNYVPLLEDLLVDQAADLAFVRVCDVCECSQLEVFGLGEFLRVKHGGYFLVEARVAEYSH
jgi:hypothetical protein